MLIKTGGTLRWTPYTQQNINESLYNKKVSTKLQTKLPPT